MTLLVGVATRKGVWIGADSGSVANSYAVAVPEPKVWNTGKGWIAAVAGDWRALELVRHTVAWPAPPKTAHDAHRTVAIDVADEIGKAFDARGFDGGEDKEEPTWWLLLGTRTASGSPVLFYFEANHAEQHTHQAVGAGEEFALGVLSQNAHMNPERRVRATLAATRKHYGVLLPPYRVESL